MHAASAACILANFLAFLDEPIYNAAMDSEKLYLKIREILVDQFEVDASIVSLDANLYEELQIDSIDAVDLLVQIKELTGVKIAPDIFRDVRTIRDVLNALTNS
jgi:acyl carrier protein